MNKINVEASYSDFGVLLFVEGLDAPMLMTDADIEAHIGNLRRAQRDFAAHQQLMADVDDATGTAE